MSAAALFFLVGYAAAQQIGTAVPEVHPKLPTMICTTANGCRMMQTSLVTDALSRPLHVVGQPGVACSITNSTLCPDPATCSQNCALEGVDYASMGVSTSGTALTLKLFNGTGTSAKTLSPRVYLLAEDDKNYQLLQLGNNQELTYDVDISKAGCGVNGALYLSEMDASGARSAANPAGAQYGTGYCDAQCFNTSTFINGLANLNGSGACCNEMDVWEANNAANAFTPHTCSTDGPFLCTGPECGATTAGLCDKSGCGVNPYRTGARSFYGPGLAVDTRRPFTVVTQFKTSTNGTTTGGGGGSSSALSEIVRMYVQDGRMVMSTSRMAMAAPGTSMNGAAGMNNNNNMDMARRSLVSSRMYSSAVSAANSSTNSSSSLTAQSAGVGSLTTDFCSANGADDFLRLGGLRGMGEALTRGMVLIFSIWDAPSDFMTWLDSGEAGPCSATQGDPQFIMMNNSDAAVTFSNIRWGDIGSTIRLTPNGTVLPPVMSSIMSAQQLAGAGRTATMTTVAAMSSLPVTVLAGLLFAFAYLLL